jgi:deoxyribonuclease-4
MAATLLGAHMPTAGGLGGAVRSGAAIGCSAIQVFTSSPRMWKSSPASEEKKKDLDAARKETGISTLVSHDTYLVNLCHVDDEISHKSLATLTDEMVRCSAYEIPFVVSHMGSFGAQEPAVALKRIAEATLKILDTTPPNVTLCMETMAGQGSSANSRFEELAIILEHCKSPDRLAVCLDTCHIFAAGYDIRTEETYDATFKEFERVIGIDKLKVIHCNDSKKPFASRVDRHADIGQGEIGLTAFRCLVNDPRFTNTPILIETPEAEEGHAKNIAKLKSLIA